MFFSKRAFNALSSSSRRSGDKSFLLLLMFRALIALIVVASRVSYLLLRCARPHGVFFGLSLRSYQFAVSTLFGVHPSVHPRSPRPGEYACVPSFPSRQESARIADHLGSSRSTLRRLARVNAGVAAWSRGAARATSASRASSQRSCPGSIAACAGATVGG